MHTVNRENIPARPRDPELERRLDEAEHRRWPVYQEWLMKHTVTTEDLEEIKLKVIQRFGYDDPIWAAEPDVRTTMTPAERERRRGLCYLPDINDLSEI